jgi:tetratricopeptide (TPR) repeat protein/transcriptional regulator with XRE-family HTH domain
MELSAPVFPPHSQKTSSSLQGRKTAVKNDRKFSLNSRLRDARTEQGWSQQDLADKIGTTSINISRWENGSTFPSPYYRQRLSKVFGKTPAELGLLPPPRPVSRKTHVKREPTPSQEADSNETPVELVLLPQPRISRIWNVPIMRNPFFTGREDLMNLLQQRLSTERTAALTQPQALFGLGGIGKTQTAAEYAFRYGDDYAHVFWMRAATSDTLAADFIKLAELLNLPEKDEQDQQAIVDAVKDWLARHEGWLLILDNADDLPLAQEFLPINHKGYVLLTTRSQASGAIAASVEVEKLTLREGTELLLRWVKLLDGDAALEQVKEADRAAAERIVQEMDGLPLAIVQAGAYIEETGCGLAKYLRLYNTHRNKLLAWRSRLIADYPETVATTWSLSFQRVEGQSSTAADLLRLCAFLAPDAIPEELLTWSIAEAGSGLSTEAGDQFQFEAALEVLRRYSLVRRDISTSMLSIHRLVQIVQRESMDEQTQRTWAERTVRVVSAAFPKIDYGTDTEHPYYQQYYLPHVQECAELIAQYQLHFAEAAQLLYQAGVFLYYRGFHPQSQSFYQQALAIREQVFGPDDPAVAEVLNVLAMLARVQGDYEQAERLHRRALTIREKKLGPQHLTTAESLNNLGVLYRSQGKYEQAEPLLQQALGIYEQSLGNEHLDTLYIFINLARLYSEQQKYEQAERLLSQALTTSERVLEPEHPLIAHILNLLARLSFERGKHKQAETLWKRSLALHEKTLGREHPATAERLNDLAELYYAQGRYAEAQSHCQRALRICEKALGSDHPDTIAYRKHLTMILNKREEEQDESDHHHPASPLS